MTAVTAARRFTWANVLAWALVCALVPQISRTRLPVVVLLLLPVLLVAAIPLAVAAVSGLAKRLE